MLFSENPPWTLSQSKQGVVTVKVDEAPATGFTVLVRGDAHHDNPKSDHALQKYHLDIARQINAPVIDNGDLFCAMQGKYDPRSNKGSLREEHRTDTYLDSMVDSTADFLEPYADLIMLLGEGNHETSIAKRCETNLTKRLARELRLRTGARVPTQGYIGFGTFQFGLGRDRLAYNLWRTHGYGGSAPVTKDTIQFSRQLGYLQNIDILISSHTHDGYAMPYVRLEVDAQGQARRRKLLALKTPTYKDDYAKLCGTSWPQEVGQNPKTLGCMWLHFGWTQDSFLPFGIEDAS